MPSATNKTIARNTLFLYFRTMVTMLVTLYTSRVVFQTLGVDDFGLYAAVGGVVGMLSFLNGALATGSSRFLTFELGMGNFDKLQKTFSTLLNAHIILAFIVAILAETIGLWFVYHKLAIPPERMDAALWVYHISILTAVISMTQVPYNASIIAHEKMRVFAWASMADAALKLGVVYLLILGNHDRLMLYAILLCVVTACLTLFYRFYCISKFKETHYKFILNREILKSVGTFSGWSLFGSATYALNAQGTNVITNIFFGPAVVTARAISVQVEMAVMQFVQNFRTAVNPQIVKKFAAQDYDGSRTLALDSTRFSFYLMLLLGLPVFLMTQHLLELWLGEVPDYAVIFVQLIIVQSLFQVLDSSFLSVLQAKGRLKENALISPLFAVARFGVVYFLFKAGYSPVVLSYAGIISFAIVSLVVKPILVCKIVGYSFRDIVGVFIPCLIVSLVAIPLPVLANYYFGGSLAGGVVVCIISVVSVLTAVFFIGIRREMRDKILSFLKNKWKNAKK